MNTGGAWRSSGALAGGGHKENNPAGSGHEQMA